MKASDTQLFKLLQGHQHYRVPLFQRPYTWSRKDWETLWSDLIEIYEMGAESEHFLGSLVTKSLPSTPEGVSLFLVIDGQQRLTTLTILLAAIRDLIREQKPTAAERIHELYLTNKFAGGTYFYKLLPTQLDRPAYFAIIDGTPGDSTTLMRQAYEFFTHRLVSDDPVEDVEITGVDLDRMEKIIASSLELVSITLDDTDNEYRIFQSLNGTGTPLSQSDLLRNYFFMRIPEKEHETAYDDVWLPMQHALGVSLEGFFRYEWMSEEGRFLRWADVYDEWRKKLDKKTSDNLIDVLLTLHHHSRFFHRLVTPTAEPDPVIQRQLTRLNRWDAQTTYPFLLQVYRRYDRGELDTAAVVEVLRMLESFLVRRTFANFPTNPLNRFFLRLAHQLPAGIDFVAGVRQVLSGPSLRWPTDDEFRDAILRYPLYVNSRPDQRRLILESLEESFGHKEQPPFDGLTIEHVMPQTLSDAWRTTLGPNAHQVHAKYLHVLGNLTLTAYNPELSNSPFDQKRELLAASNLAMNREIAEQTEWTESQIIERGNRLAERAIEIWPGPD